MVSFEAFYSHSFDKKDKDICEIFKKIFESFDFKIYEHKQREGNELNNEIIDHIREKDVFIGVLTKNHSFWLTNEMSVAYALKKDKILIFYEDGIEKSGFLSSSAIRKIPFQREDLLNSLIDNNILGNIYKFKEYLIGKMYFPFYMFEEIYAIRRIIDKDNYEIRERRSVISLNDALTEIPYTSKAINKKDIDVSAKEFSFKVLEKPSNKSVNYKIDCNIPREFKFFTLISPKLSKGEKIVYQFKIKMNNIKEYYKEDVDIGNRKYLGIYYQNTYLQRISTTISQPTKKLILEVEFPENYKIKKYGYYIFLARTSNRNKDEEKQARVKLIDRIDRQILQLKIIYPKINHNYNLYWEPPSKEDIQ